MEFPDSIEDFGYNFNEDGQLRSIATGEPYQFQFKEDDHRYNQKRYEALGEVITSYVYHCLEDKCGLKRLSVPLNPSAGDPKTFIFCSENYNTSDKLLILIHGSGVVRAGQWARRLIINDCIDSGTQIPFIKRGQQEGYGIIVMNTNDNTELIDGKRLPITGSDSPEVHGKYVWKNYVRKCTASHVAIIAHSYGGVVLTKLADKFANEFHNRVFAVALTDSVHFRIPKNSNLIKVGRNWIGSSKPLDTTVERRFGDIKCVSAGCIEHELTSWSSFDSIFKFFSERLSLSVESVELESSLSSPPKKRICDPLTLEDHEEIGAEGNTSNGDSFEINAHSISPDHVDDDGDSKIHSKESDQNEILEPMEAECQPLEPSKTDGGSSHATELLIVDPSSGMESDPSPGIEPDPSPVIELDPSPGIEPDPSPGIEPDPSPGIESDPSPGIESDPSQGMVSNPTDAMKVALEADVNDGDSEILDLSNSQVVEKLVDSTSPELKETSKTANSPVAKVLPGSV